jgi:cytoskeleton protein RodZ
LTFFQRIKTPFTESAADEQARYQPRMWVVGEVLQERREELGLELDEIGAMLRIKPAYLAALEQGRTHDLPGPTYAIGFVRAYAEFLGLESEPVLARFKAEAAGVTARPDLALPVPLGERSLPGGALVLVALIVALCGYGIWYYVSTEERSRPERVVAVPAALQPTPPASSLVAPPASPPASDTSASPPPPAPSLFGAAAGPAPAAGTPSPSLPPLPASVAPPPAPAAPVVGSAQPAMPAPGQAAPTPATPLSQGALITTMPRGAGAAGAPATNPAPAPAVPTQAIPAPTPQPTQMAAAPAAATPAPTAAAPAPPAASGAGAAPGRVTIRALADCWIQVRGPDASIVFSRVLKSGEVYTVPSKPGLSLRTGNAGALEIAVDGKAAPSIGGVGTLRRDVGLDPTELEAGTAVHG